MTGVAASPLRISDPDEAIALLRAGGVVAIPTETVYGLAADATCPEAIIRVFEIKGRPRDHPLIVHLADRVHLGHWARVIPPSAHLLAETCWPGPLTMLVPRSEATSDLITGGRDAVAVRVPSHLLARQVLGAFDGLVAPSANRFGHVSPTTADHVLADLADLLEPGRDGVLDGGPCEIGLESTIVDCTTDPPQVLRPGGIAAEDIERLLQSPLAAAQGPHRASGMLSSHYAPRCQVFLIDHDAPAGAETFRRQTAPGRIEVVDLGSDLVVAARELYAELRRADERHLDGIVIRLPPPVGLGHAIRDRLMKAAAGTANPGSADPDHPSRAD